MFAISTFMYIYINIFVWNENQTDPAFLLILKKTKRIERSTVYTSLRPNVLVWMFVYLFMYLFDQHHFQQKGGEGESAVYFPNGWGRCVLFLIVILWEHFKRRRSLSTSVSGVVCIVKTAEICHHADVCGEH